MGVTSKEWKGYAALFCISWLVLGPRTAEADDFTTIKDRMFQSAFSKASHTSLQEILPLLNDNGAFSDLKYGKDASVSFMEHGRRQGALLYHHHNGEMDLTKEVTNCFNYITNDAPPNIDPNWWGHVIGTPLKMWEGAVMAEGVIEFNLLLDFLERWWVHVFEGPVWDFDLIATKFAGGNFGPRAFLGEVEGLLRGRDFHKQRHSEVDERLYPELAQRQPFEENGIRPDGCIHQHNPQGNRTTEGGFFLDHTLGHPYSATYGSELTRHISLMMTWYTGTSLDYNSTSVEGLYSTYLECLQWIFRGNVIEPTMAGRKIPDGGTITYYSTGGLIHDTGLNLKEINRHVAEVDSVLHRYDNTKPDPEYALVGHRHFFNTDLSVQQRREYYASVRILSNRTARPESWDSGENKDGFFQADGFMTVLVDGGEYGQLKSEVFQVYDWARVPSVTNQYTKDIPTYMMDTYHSRHFFNNARFSGGVTDESIGLASMVYSRPYVPLKAFKSWFFFDDVILVLGSGITMDPEGVTTEEVGTTLTQIAFEGSYVACTNTGEELTLGMGDWKGENPTWLFHRQVGYVFLNGDEQLQISAETRVNKTVGDNLDLFMDNDEHIRSSSDDDNGPIDMFTSWITHGVDPLEATVAYAVLPATTLEATREFSRNPTVEIITQESDKHVVCHHRSIAIGASLSTTGKVTVDSCGGAGPFEIEVDTPCLLLATLEESSPKEATIALSLADPQQMYDVINVRLTFEGRHVERKIEMPLDPKRGSSLTQKIVV